MSIDHTPAATRYEEIADLMTNAQLGILRRCKPGEILYAIMTIGWKQRDSTPDVLWSAGFPPDVTPTRCIEMLREAAKILLWQAAEMEGGR